MDYEMKKMKIEEFLVKVREEKEEIERIDERMESQKIREGMVKRMNMNEEVE